MPGLRGLVRPLEQNAHFMLVILSTILRNTNFRAKIRNRLLDPLFPSLGPKARIMVNGEIKASKDVELAVTALLEMMPKI